MKDFKTKNGFFTGNVGIGTTNPGGSLHVKGAGTHGVIKLEAGGTSGSDNLIHIKGAKAGGTSLGEIHFDEMATNAGDIIFQTNNGTTLSEKMRVTSGGNVGIGTSSPSSSYALEVSGKTWIREQLRILGTATDSGSGHILLQNNVSTGSKNFYIGNDYTGTSTVPNGLSIKTSNYNVTDWSSASTIMHVTNGGYVGIGTTNPASKFEIYGTGDLLRLYSTNTGAGGAQVDLIHDSSSPADGDSAGLINFLGRDADSNLTTWASIRGAVGDLTNKGGDITFSTRLGSNFTESMRITHDGYVGIGTSNPNGTLTVRNGNTETVQLILGNAMNSGGRDWRLGRDNVTTGDFIISYSDISNDNNTTEAMRIDDSGNVGIGTSDTGNYQLLLNRSNSEARLKISSSTSSAATLLFGEDASGGGTPAWIQRYGSTHSTKPGKVEIGAAGSGSWIALQGDGGADILNVRGSGNVGIGTTNPGIQLDCFTDDADAIARFTNTSNFPFGINVRYTNASPDSSTTNWFLDCEDSTTSRLIIWGDGDVQNHDGTYGQLSSDLRLKENVVDASGKLEDLMSLEVKNYNFIGEDKKMIGFVAQDFEKIFPSLVTITDTREYDDDGNVTSGFEDARGMKVGVEFAILTKAIQEQQAIIEDLKARIETLES